MAKPIYIYTGTEWVPVGPQIGNIAYNWIYTATGSETSLSGTDDNGLTLSYTPNYEQVYLNGVLLTRGTDYTAASSSSITGLSALTSGDVINVLVLEATTVDNTYTQNQVDVLLNDKADLASPDLTGTPTAPTATQWDASTQIATTEFVNNQTVAINQFGAAGSQLLNLPSQVHPAEKLLKQAVWYIDSAHESAGDQEISNLGWGGNVLNAQSGSTTGADSNDPKFLDWEGENYVYLPNVVGNYLSVPDESALDITGDIDLRVYLVSDDYVDSTNRGLITKFASGQISYAFSISSSNLMELRLTNDGSTQVVASSSASVSALTNGEPYWLRVTWRQSDGRVQFFYGLSDSSWTQLGTDQTASVASIYVSATDISIGHLGTGARAIDANIYRAQVLDGIDGTPVLDIDTSQISSGSDTSFPALTGQTVSINRSTSGRKSVAVTHPVWLFGTDDYMDTPNSDLLNFGASDDFTVLAMWRWFDTPTDAGAIVSKAVSNPTALYQVFGSSTTYAVVGQIGDDTNTKQTDTSGASSQGTLNVGGMVIDRTSQLITAYMNGVDSGSPSSTTSVGSQSNTSVLRIGTRAYGGRPCDMEFIAAAIFRRALTAGEIATLTNYFKARTGG